MPRRLVWFAAATIVTTIAVVTATGTPARSASAATGVDVVVVAKGSSLRKRDPFDVCSPYTWGVVLKNRSQARDALNVDVYIESKSGGGTLEDGYGVVLAVVPAGASVYLGSDGCVESRVRRMRVSIDVGSSVSKQHRLPPVTDVRVNRSERTITATVTNPYQRPLSLGLGSIQSMVLFDRKGRVIGGSSLAFFDGLARSVPQGRRAQFHFETPKGVSPERIGSARVTFTLRGR